MSNKKKILIVDDESDIVELLSLRLESEGFEVISAGDGYTALDKARKDKPDLIILDLMLPKINGYKVCRILKFDEKHKGIPIIIFTARGQDQDKQLGKEVGADAYLVKPFEPQILMKTINKLLSHHK